MYTYIYEIHRKEKEKKLPRSDFGLLKYKTPGKKRQVCKSMVST